MTDKEIKRKAGLLHSMHPNHSTETIENMIRSWERVYRMGACADRAAKSFKILAEAGKVGALAGKNFSSCVMDEAVFCKRPIPRALIKRRKIRNRK